MDQASGGKGAGWPSVLVGPSGMQSGLHVDRDELPSPPAFFAVVRRGLSRFWAVVANADLPNQPLKHFRILMADEPLAYLASAVAL